MTALSYESDSSSVESDARDPLLPAEVKKMPKTITPLPKLQIGIVREAIAVAEALPGRLSQKPLIYKAHFV